MFGVPTEGSIYFSTASYCVHYKMVYFERRKYSLRVATVKISDCFR